MRASIRPRGFTIVELVVVIAVIGILTTVTIVSYSRTRDRAKTEQARTNALTVQKVAEAYYTRNNQYPATVADFSNTHTTMPGNIELITSGTLTKQNGENSILYRRISTFNGACILYWDFDPEDGSNPGIKLLTRLGTATAANCSETVGILPT